MGIVYLHHAMKAKKQVFMWKYRFDATDYILHGLYKQPTIVKAILRWVPRLQPLQLIQLKFLAVRTRRPKIDMTKTYGKFMSKPEKI